MDSKHQIMRVNFAIVNWGLIPSQYLTVTSKSKQNVESTHHKKKKTFSLKTAWVFHTRVLLVSCIYSDGWFEFQAFSILGFISCLLLQGCFGPCSMRQQPKRGSKQRKKPYMSQNIRYVVMQGT